MKLGSDFMWLELVGSIIALVGVIFIFDGRRVVKKYLNFGEENLAVQGIKIFGLLLGIVGFVMII